MSHSFLKPILALLLVSLTMPLAHAVPAHAETPGSNRDHTVLTAQLPPNMNGKNLHVTLIAVHYGPGEASPSHTHACPVIVYVLKGTVRSEIKGQPITLYHAGESFYESPGGLHLISENASKTSSARFLAFFVCDHNAPLSTNLPRAGSGEPR